MTLLPAWAPNAHPLLVHLPIGMWVGAVAADLIAVVFRRASRADAAASFLYPAGALAAVLAYLTGQRAAATVLVPGMAFPLLEQHEDWALAATILFALVAAIRLWVRRRATETTRAVRIALAAAALLALAALVGTGERGARLVFQHGVGVTGSGALR
jgi:uncharacterized membrane protein